MNPHFDYQGTVMQATLAAQRALEQAGLQVLRSFELQGHGPRDRHCPQHGKGRCGCQYTVLLVYPGSGPPAAVTSHSNGGHARLEIILDPNTVPDTVLVNQILEALGSTTGENS